MKSITIRHLRAAITVGRFNSFRRAAETLNITQPALSTTISDLERDLGLRIFDRTSRVVSTTVLGKEFLRGAAEVVRDFDDLIERTVDIARSNRGRVVVSCPATLAGRLMPRLVRKCGEIHPNIEVTVRDEVVAETIATVEEGRCDFGITVRTLDLPDRLVTETLFRDPYSVVLPRSHPLAEREKIEWTDLEGEVHVSFNPQSGTQPLVAREAERQSVNFKEVHAVAQLATATAMLEEGVGIGILPELALPHPDHPYLTVVPLIAPELSREIVLLQRRDKSLSPAAGAFRRLVLSEVSR